MKKIALCLALAAGLPACGNEPKTLQEVDSHISKVETRIRALGVTVTADDMEQAAEPAFQAMKWQMAHGTDGFDEMIFGINTRKGKANVITLAYAVKDLKTVNWADDAGPASDKLRGTALGLVEAAWLGDEGPAMIDHFCQSRTSSAYERFCAEAKK